MNERIRGMWVKADNFARPSGQPSKMMEKFAELIIKDCIDEIHAVNLGNLKGQAYYLDKVAEHIEEHFGINNEVN